MMQKTIVEQVRNIQSGGYSNDGDRASYMAARSYLWMRQRSRARGIFPAASALKQARHDGTENIERSLDSAKAIYSIGAPSDDGLRWVECPSAMGLRFCGFVDEGDSRIRHKGWFTDDFGDNGELLRGAVYQLPARRGNSVFVVGYRSGYSNRDGEWLDSSGSKTRPARIDLSNIYTSPSYIEPCDVVFIADKIAETAAGIEREFNAAWQAGSEFGSVVDDVKMWTKALRELLQETRPLRRDPDTIKDNPAIRACICDGVAKYRRWLNKARVKRDELLHDYQSYKDSRQDDLWQQFCEGAGIPS